MVRHFLDGGFGEFPVCLEYHVTCLGIGDVEVGLLVEQQLGIGRLGHLLAEENLLAPVVVVQKLLGSIAQRFEQDGSRHFPPSVDAHIEYVLVVELEIQPGSAIGNYPCRIEHLAA